MRVSDDEDIRRWWAIDVLLVMECRDEGCWTSKLFDSPGRPLLVWAKYMTLLMLEIQSARTKQKGPARKDGVG